jgi:hypothetical protein
MEGQGVAADWERPVLRFFGGPQKGDQPFLDYYATIVAQRS